MSRKSKQGTTVLTAIEQVVINPNDFVTKTITEVVPPPPPPPPPAPPPPPRPAACCANCPCYHRSSNPTQDKTCRRDPPKYNIGAPNCRSWAPMLPTDCCWEHPLQQAKLQAQIKIELERLLAVGQGQEPSGA